jgi:hypothetical protein
MVGDADSGEEKHMSISFADFLDVLYDAAAAYTTVSVKLTDGRFVCQTFSLAQRAEIVAYIQKHINYDIYIKRASQYVRPERGSSGSAEIAYYQRVITADIDIRSAAHAKDALPASKDDALKLLEESGLPEPTLIVHTGNGLMPMWVLRTPQWINDVAPIQAGVEAQLRIAAARYGWTLDNTSDAARSIRVIGSRTTGSSARRRSRLRLLETATATTTSRDLARVRAQAAARTEARRRRGDAGND